MNTYALAYPLNPLRHLVITCNNEGKLEKISIVSGDEKWDASKHGLKHKHDVPAAVTILADFFDDYFSTDPQKAPVNMRKTSESLIAKDFSTPFSCAVLWAICDIDAGQTLTYSQLAQKIGKPKAARAVGNALAKNPFAILMPCHRIVNKSGLVMRYAYGGDVKRELLAHESAVALARAKTLF